MRKCLYGMIAGAVGLGLGNRCGATIIYLQNFSASAGMTGLSTVNWNAYYGSATTPATVATAGSSGVPANAMISGGPSAPTPGANVNAAAAVSSTANGFVPLLSSDGADQFVAYTNEYSIDPAAGTPTFSWYAASGYTGDLQRLIVEIGGNWYASTAPISPPSGVIQGTSFQAGSGDFSTVFSTGALGWDSLNFSPGSDLTLGPALTTPLPSGSITGFGIYAQIANNSKGNERTFFDTFEVTTTVPEPVSGAIFVCAGGLLSRRRRVLR